MGWSTQEVAGLAGTTLRTVRHYHDEGLLAEPGRSANGYKQYGVDHLVRLLRIRRLVDLGVPLDRIRDLDDTLEPSADELGQIDAELQASIDKLTELRAELRRRVRVAAPSELPLELAFAANDERIPEADRMLLVVLCRVLDRSALQALADSIREPRVQAEHDFDALTADSGTDACRDVAERLLPHSMRLRRTYPGLPDLFAPGMPRAVHSALDDLYNPAQVDVYRRLSAMRRTST